MSGTTQIAKDFFQRREGWGGTQSNFWLGLVVTVIGGLVLLATASGGIQVGLGILLMFTARWAQNNPLARIHSDHLEMKAAIAAPKHLVLFSDIVSVREELPKKVTLVTRQGKDVVVPLRALALEDGTALLNLLRTKINEQGVTV